MTSGTKASSPVGRQIWLDVARGIGIILVVNGHVLDGLRSADMLPGSYDEVWSYLLYTFHMPLFFYLAGLNVERSLRRGRASFVADKARSLLYPYVVWSLLQGSLSVILAGHVNQGLAVSDLLDIWYQPIAQFWFLYGLMACHLVAAALLPSRLAAAVVAAVAFALMLGMPHLRSDVAATLHHLAFYVAAFFVRPRALGRGVLGGEASGLRQGWAWTAGTWLAFAVAVWIGGVLSQFEFLSIFSLPAGVLGVAGTVLLARQLGAAAPAWLLRVGQLSMSIYVMHIMAIAGLRVVWQASHLPMPPWASIALLTAVGIALPMAAHVVLQRLHLLTVLGLAPFGRRGAGPSDLLPTPAR